MNFFSAMDILASSLAAERVRMNVSASNLANAQTTRSASGGPYRRKDPVFSSTSITDDPFAGELEQALRGVEVESTQTDTSAPRRVYSPEHPDADAKGYVNMPNVNMVEEMVNMITASRSYEAGISAMSAVIQMAQRALTLGR